MVNLYALAESHFAMSRHDRTAIYSIVCFLCCHGNSENDIDEKTKKNDLGLNSWECLNDFKRTKILQLLEYRVNKSVHFPNRKTVFRETKKKTRLNKTPSEI